MASHLEGCPREIVRCYYAGAGCDFHDERQTLPAHHDNIAYHMQLIYQVADADKKAVSELRQANSALRQEVTEVRAENALLKEQVSEQEARSEQRQANTVQEVTELKGKNMHLSERVSELGQEVRELKAVNSCVLEQVPVLGEVNSHMDGSPTSEVNAISGMAASARVSSATALSPSPLRHRLTTRPTGGAQDRHKVSDLSTQNLLGRMSDLELRQNLLEVQGSNGVLMWRISDIRQRVAEAKTGHTPSLYSPPFCSSGGTAGYKMCGRVYLNGDGAGKDTYISMYFVMMRGDFDALLPWPFRQMVTFSLLDQSGDKKPEHIAETFQPDVTSSSFQRPTSDMNIATGCPRFAPKSCLLSDRYVKDDTIFLRVDVPVLGPLSPQ